MSNQCLMTKQLRLTEGASEVVRDARPLTATALQFGRMQCSAARKLSRVDLTVSFVNSLALRDRLQNQSRTKEVSEPNRYSR